MSLGAMTENGVCVQCQIIRQMLIRIENPLNEEQAKSNRIKCLQCYHIQIQCAKLCKTRAIRQRHVNDNELCDFMLKYRRH